MLYHRFLLVIYFKYSSFYMSIPISQYIPLPYTCNHKFIFYYTSVTLLLFSKWRYLFTPFFLDSTYKQYIFVFLYLTSFTQYDNLYIHTCCCKWHYFFCGWAIFHCPYVSHLIYLFLCCWTFRLLPYPGYCK